MEISTTSLAIFAVIAMLGLVGVVAVAIVSVPENVEAKGCKTSQAFNKSQGRCFHP
jgi:hypothetical protein